MLGTLSNFLLLYYLKKPLRLVYLETHNLSIAKSIVKSIDKAELTKCIYSKNTIFANNGNNFNDVIRDDFKLLFLRNY